MARGERSMFGDALVKIMAGVWSWRETFFFLLACPTRGARGIAHQHRNS